MFELLLIQNKG